MIDHFEEDHIETLRSWDDAAAAQVYDDRIRFLEKRDKLTFAERGLIMLEMESRELWRHVSGGLFASLSDWIENAAPESHGNCRAALKVARALRNIIPASEQNEIKRCNLEVLSRVSSSVAKRPEIRQAAKGTNADLVAKIQREHPDEHLESITPYRFKPEESAREKIDEALQMAMVLEEATTREEALECIAESYILDHHEEYEQIMRKRKTAEASMVVQ